MRLRLLTHLSLSWLAVSIWSLAAAILTWSDSNVARFLDRQFQVAFYQIRDQLAPAQPPPQILIVAIDQDSLSAAKDYASDPQKTKVTQFMKNWPWSRAAYAEAIERLVQGGAKVVALDLLLDLPSGDGPADDRQLQQTLQRHHQQVVLASIYQDSIAPQGTTYEWIGPAESLRTNSLRLGLANYPEAEKDGRIYTLSTEYARQVLRPLKLPEFPSFSTVTLQTSGLPYPSPQGQDIFFYGGAGSFKTISFWQVLADDWWQVFERNQTFRNKIVLIGTTIDSSEFSDFHQTPAFNKAFSSRMAGVELHANEIASLLEGKTIAQLIPTASGRGWLVLVLVAMVGSSLHWLKKSPPLRLVLGLSIGILWLGISYWGFVQWQWVLPTAVPVLAIALTSFSQFFISITQELLEKLRLRLTLSRYVAAQVVNEILKQPDNLLRARKLKVAVLFADIRGFTTLSYKLPSEQLLEQLNRYFSEMVNVITAAGGTVDKFIGDAIMAEFGFPTSQGERQDARNAIEAALAMRRVAYGLRQQFLQEGKVPFFNGIGISFGEVIAGDIGALQRREYGVIGDTVNVASRVEGLTKQFWTDILITDALYQQVADLVEVVALGEHYLKGRQEHTVALYGLIGWKGDDQSFYHQVMEDLRLYLNQSPSQASDQAHPSQT